MKRLWKPSIPFLIALFAVIPARADTGHGAAAAPDPSFERLKKLAGDWEAPGEGGQIMRESIRVTAGGSTVMEEMFPGKPHAMVTMYHPDGKDLVATHYCAGGNQPRLRSKGLAADGKTMVFAFADATNLPSPDAEHMHQLEITFLDDDHYDAKWSSAGQKDVHSEPMVFHWARAKALPTPVPPATK